MIRGIRGAITVEQNTESAILDATGELMAELIKANRMEPEDIASVFATVTEDLDATFPARAIRSIPGWELVPVMCAREIPVPGSIAKCIRVLILVNTTTPQKDIRHVYLRHATRLRPDLTEKSGS